MISVFPFFEMIDFAQTAHSTARAVHLHHTVKNTHWIAELLKLLTGASALCVTLGGLEICSA